MYPTRSRGASDYPRERLTPGLWLDPAALLARDTRRLHAVVDLGLAAPGHAAFVAGLASAGS